MNINEMLQLLEVMKIAGVSIEEAIDSIKSLSQAIQDVAGNGIVEQYSQNIEDNRIIPVEDDEEYDNRIN